MSEIGLSHYLTLSIIIFAPIFFKIEKRESFLLMTDSLMIRLFPISIVKSVCLRDSKETSVIKLCPNSFCCLSCEGERKNKTKNIKDINTNK